MLIIMTINVLKTRECRCVAQEALPTPSTTSLPSDGSGRNNTVYRRGGRMSRAPACCSGISGYPKVAVSSPDLADV